MNQEHELLDTPSEWVLRFASEIPAGGSVLDVACGGGRHARYFAARGHPVTAVDRAPLPVAIDQVKFVLADIENGSWPFAGQTFAAVVVTNYLHRPLFPVLLQTVAQGGVLIYETFALGNERFGRPSRADFLLKPNELFDVIRNELLVIAFEDVTVQHPKPARVQRIVAARRDLSAPAIG